MKICQQEDLFAAGKRRWPVSGVRDSWLHSLRIAHSLDCQDYSVPVAHDLSSLCPRSGRGSAQGNDFLWRTVTTTMSSGRNLAPLYLAPSPSARRGGSPAGAIQSIFIRRVKNSRNEVRTVMVRAAGEQISGEALRTLDAMANSGGHGASIRVLRMWRSARAISFPISFGDWLRLRFVNIDRVMKDGRTFADFDPPLLDVCGLASSENVQFRFLERLS